MKPEIALMIYVRDLLGLDEMIGEYVQVGVGRTNIERGSDYTALQIIVDTLSPNIRTNRSQKYDDVNEVMTYTTDLVGDFTIDFYGDDAFDKMTEFMNLHRSQAAYELQRDNQIRVMEPKNATNLKLLTGESYSERWQIQLEMQQVSSTDVSTLRIDQAQVEINTEQQEKITFVTQ